ncbi:cytochrome c oxidase subunit 3 [Sphaerisporangium fuscum]|uniref:cytochrome c oxidase subunit 3 n=1 Tax=Sphaerisporangium fuscum TaxID=2835868 RepID=UPI001BDCC4B9|nr:heme-copper oxidase subunit III [Sphaerisporangium fuscum]
MSTAKGRTSVKGVVGAEPVPPQYGLPGGRSPAWWGMVLFVATEATLFACLLGSYFYIRFSHFGAWPPGGIKDPELGKPLVMTVLLFSSSAPMVWADWAVRHDRVGQLKAGLALTLALGIAFVSLQGTEYATKLKEFTWSTNVYGSLFYTITGFHGLHVIVGLVMIVFIGVAALSGKFGSRHHERVRLVAFYWHFVDAVWIFILSTIYLSPHL